MPGKPRENPRTRRKNTIEARGIKMQKLDADAQPVGEPVTMEGTATVELSGEWALDPHSEPLDLAPGVTAEFSSDDPATVKLARELTRIPVPTAVISQWFPAFFRAPGQAEPWRLCKVFLTPQGLYVYRQPPVEPETFTSGAMPAWYSGVDFEETRRPATGRTASNAGIPIVTAAGTALVQPTGGCGCAAGRIKHWRPTWARNVISWADGVALAGDATNGR